MSEQKSTVETIDQYISLFPDHIKEMMQQLRQIIKETAPQASETISWEMPTFKVKRILVQFAGHNRHIGFYPQPEAIEAFKSRLSAYKTTKGGIQFPYDQELPVELISEIVRYRLQLLENNKK